MDVILRSSDGETRPGFSSEPQSTGLMQTSTGESEGDRRESVDGDEVKDKEKEEEDSDSHCDKDSFDSLEYNSSEEEEEESEEEEEEEEEDSDSNWDKDSFEGKEYNFADYDGDYSEDEELERMSHCYHRTVIESKGFFERDDGFPPCIWGGFSRVTDLDAELRDKMTVRQFLSIWASECVEKYNKTKNKNVRFHQFLRANRQCESMVKYYITFLARESDSLDDPLIEYQAKVARQGESETLDCILRRQRFYDLFITDSMDVLHMVQNLVFWPALVSELEEFQKLRDQLRPLRIVYEPREKNVQADLLARKARERQQLLTYIGTALPHWLMDETSIFD